MNKLEGKNADDGDDKPSDEQAKMLIEVNKINCMGSELMGIANSIETLIKMFNNKVNENLGGLIKLPPEHYRSIFTSDVQRLDELIQGEVEQRQVLQG